jgi:hypothetical protein
MDQTISTIIAAGVPTLSVIIAIVRNEAATTGLGTRVSNLESSLATRISNLESRLDARIETLDRDLRE